MVRLGLRLTLRSGREAVTRLVVTAAAVAAGVAIMLAVLADFHAFQVTSARPDWEATTAMRPAAGAAAGRTELWNYSNEVFRGQTIERLDVAALGSRAPVPPGLQRLPAAGQYYASPALAALLRSAPRDQLAGRYPGTLAGTIGARALTGPGELVIVVGRTPAALAALPGTIKVDKIATSPGQQVWSSYFRDAFAVGALAFLLPILILIGTATRLASARREERYAALRLVGATSADVAILASVDAVVSALLGAAAGVGLFMLIRPALAGTAITSARYFPAEVTPPAWGYLAILAGVPAAAAVTSVLALRRVRLTPLGVSRRVAPSPPSTWRIAPLLAGAVLFVAGMLLTTSQNIGAPAFPGLLVIMIGLVIGGPWLTERAARLLPATGRASSILAARRLADNPKAAFRSVSGLVLAVFLGTVVAALLPAVNATTATPSARALSNVLLDGFTASPVCGNTVNCTGSPGPGAGGAGSARVRAMALNGLPPAAGSRLMAGLAAFRGATAVPVYALPLSRQPGPGGKPSGGPPAGPPARLPEFTAVVGCGGISEIGALGRCRPHAGYAKANTLNLFGDNPTYTTQPIVNRASPAYHGDVRRLFLQAVLVKVSSRAELERVRTYLITHTEESVSGSAPRTFGEAVSARLSVAATVQRLVDIAVALTLLVAGCSLAVAAGGGLVERKRPFTMLRLTGAPAGTLYRVVLTEAIAPLVAATLVAAGTAYGISLLTIAKMAPPGTPLPGLGHVYYLTMGAGLAVSLLVILATLPLLSRITGPEHVRFE